MRVYSDANARHVSAYGPSPTFIDLLLGVLCQVATVSISMCLNKDNIIHAPYVPPALSVPPSVFLDDTDSLTLTVRYVSLIIWINICIMSSTD